MRLLTENERLRGLLKKSDDGGDGLPNDDADDETGTGDELNPPDDAPTKGPKKSKKKTKAADEDDDQGEPAPDDEERRDDSPNKRPAPPAKNDDRQEKDAAAYWNHAFAQAPRSASPEAILAGVQARRVMPPQGSSLSVNSYQRHVAVSAAMVIHAARVARGRVDSPLPPVGTYARMILDAAAEARGLPSEDR